MSKIKICYLVSSLCNEGPVNVIYNIVKYINFDMFDVSIVTLTPEKENSRLKDFFDLPIIVKQLSPIKYKSLLSLYFFLMKELRTLSPNIVHAHCSRSLYLLALLPHKFLKTYTIHIYPGIQHIKMHGIIKGRVLCSLNHFFTKYMDLPIACSQSVAEQYKIIKKLDVESIPNGTSVPVWNFDEEEKYRLRRNLGMRQDYKYFIFIGRFSEEKNPTLVFNSFCSLNDKKIGLVMLGDGPVRKDLLSNRYENIILPGFTNKVVDYIKASDYYISASEVEGLANTLLECMAVGLPMLLSNIPSHNEVLKYISNNKEVALILDNTDIETIKNGISEIINIDTGKARVILQNLFLSRYTAKKMSESYQKLYLYYMKNEKTRNEQCEHL